MRISYNWLKEYVDVKIRPERLAEFLTMSGTEVTSIEKRGRDYIMELEVTSNRPDCLSTIGIAREVAAITGKRLKIPKKAYSSAVKARSRKRIKIAIEDKKLCPRYTGRVIERTKVGASPKWLRDKIESMGLRPVNNIVDISNFCLFETGEPMHAFDLDKISGGEVRIKRARKGEKIITIDGVKRDLDETILVIADREKPIAIAGVMGGLDTEVADSTKNILLEAAIFDPISIRRTSRKLGISTESSYRFERKIDPASVLFASKRATSIISRMGLGAVGQLVDAGKKTFKPKAVYLRYSRLDDILGLKIPPADVKAILGRLGLRLSPGAKKGLKAMLPSFRQDLDKEIDLIEEVARVYGYDKIPLTFPEIVEQPIRRSASSIVEKRVREVLTSFGLEEVVTYSLLSSRLLNEANLADAQEIVNVKNPLSAEQEVMRTSLIPGLLGVILRNINRTFKDLGFFELSGVYLRRGRKDYAEKRHLSIGITGKSYSNWRMGTRDVSFFELKGMLESLFSELGIEDFKFLPTENKILSRNVAASIEVGGKLVGFGGEISRGVLDSFDIGQKVYVFELSFDDILTCARLERTYREVPKYPSSTRDISLIVKEDVTNSDINILINKEGAGLVKGVRLFDLYSGRQIPDGKKGLAYRVEYQHASRTLEDSEVNEVHSRICDALVQVLGAKLR